MLRQVCAALSEAHGIGLIHRDIKPGNIIISIRGGLHDVAKLVDFGLVQTQGAGGGDPTQEDGIVGTPAYMCPEQAAGQEQLDGRSDVYSLGAVAYFLLVGEPPFVRPNVLQVLAAHVSDTVALPNRLREELPVDLQAVVLRCLEKNPADRFADAAGLDRALGACACAGLWTNAKAAQWWKEQGNERAAIPTPTLPSTRPA